MSDIVLGIILVSMNLQAHMAIWKVVKSVKKVKKAGRRAPDLWAFQEIGGLRKWLAIRAALGMHQYAGMRLKGDGAATPVAWQRSRYRRERSRGWFLSKRTKVGKPGAGPSTLRGKKAPIVVLWHKKLKRHVVLCDVHLAPQPTLNDQRGALSKLQVIRLVVMYRWIMEHYPDAVVLIPGDYNITDRELLAPLVLAGLRIGRDKADHGKHALSRVMTNVPHHGMTLIDEYSDHDALIARL